MKKLILCLKRLFRCFVIDYSFLIMLILFFLLDDLKFYFIYLVFIFLHEMSHLIVAKKLGYLPKKLKLTAFGASLEGFDDFLMADEIKIALAGPIFNFVISVICYLCFWFYPESYSVLSDILAVNLSILIFNIIPVFPLDAGRIMLCFLSRKKRRCEAVNLTKNISLVIVCLMFILSIISFFMSFGFGLGFVSINLCLLLFSSSKDTSFKREILLNKKLKRLNKGLAQKTLLVSENYPENLLLKFIDGEHYFIFVFVNERFEKIRELDERTLLLRLGFI